MTLISVVIPSYNHEMFIQHAVKSVLDQSYKNLELIVVDDGSKDSSLNYLRTVDDSRYTLFEQNNAGAHNAINKGLSIAKGEYLAILNSDDVFYPDRLAECLKRLQSGVDLVASWIEVIDDKGKKRGVKKGWKNMLPWPINKQKHGLATLDEFTFNLLMTNFVSTTSNIVFTRDLYEKIGGMRNLRFVHDWDFLLRAARDFRCELIDKPLLQYRVHDTNTISSNRKWMLFEICWIFAVHLKNFTTKFSPDSKLQEKISSEISFLSQSINLQGNDKVMWMLLCYLNECENQGNYLPEEMLLNDEYLRSLFIAHIIS